MLWKHWSGKKAALFLCTFPNGMRGGASICANYPSSRWRGDFFDNLKYKLNLILERRFYAVTTTNTKPRP